ncbi:hypothetical protein Pse7367_3635 [Thalassoporum mexicanum PCC 7367]|uniref:hypothetical protein n=1 Tax=Thalassoporum mexicanum TaxID=3457544 RepID=UPI00029F8850|nr:hypothetical protein [Pseudanabaena sp. PCC 7367]AFY71868.1 hypothetical protein Pse7367_3635 [Pseudanabaena sp. PCC 7367]
MTYKKQLHPWSIVRSLAGGQKISVGRFRRYNDASSHLLFLGRIMPTLDHSIVFDPMDRLHADDPNSKELEQAGSKQSIDRGEQTQPETASTQPEVGVVLEQAQPYKPTIEPVLTPKKRRSARSLRLVE